MTTPILRCSAWRIYVFVALAMLIGLPLQAQPQQPLDLNFSVLGGIREENPDNPNFPTMALFEGQPAVFQIEIINNTGVEQTIFSGGGGNAGFTMESVAVEPAGVGTCTLDQAIGFVDCAELVIPASGSGKVESNGGKIIIYVGVIPFAVGSGGLSWFAGFSAFSGSGGFATDVRTVGQTHTLTVESLPPLVDITATPGGIGEATFTREYPEGVQVSLEAPEEIVTALFPLDFFAWEVDGQDESESRKTTITMDQDHTALALYGAPFFFSLVDPNDGLVAPKSAGPIDIYANGIQVVDDLSEDQSTPFVTAPLQATIDITDAGAQDNSNPLMSFSYESDGAPALIMLTEEDHFIHQNARVEAVDATQTDIIFFLPLTQETLDTIRLVHRTATEEIELFGADTPVDDNNFTSYFSLPPGDGVVEVLSRSDDTQIEAFQATFSEGDALLGVLLQSDSGQGFSLLAFDAEGNALDPVVVTSTDAQADQPAAFALYENYPNPFNPTTTLHFDVPKHTHVRLAVSNVLGQVVAVLVDESLAPGHHAVSLNGSDWPSGTYFYRLEAGSFEAVRKMLLVK